MIISLFTHLPNTQSSDNHYARSSYFRNRTNPRLRTLGEIIVGFRCYVTQDRAIAIGESYGIQAIDFFGVFPFLNAVIYKVPEGEEFLWKAKFYSRFNVLFTEFNCGGSGY